MTQLSKTKNSLALKYSKDFIIHVFLLNYTSLISVFLRKQKNISEKKIPLN